MVDDMDIKQNKEPNHRTGLLLYVLDYNYIILENYLKLIIIDSKLFYKLICSTPKVKDIIVFIFLNNSI